MVSVHNAYAALDNDAALPAQVQKELPQKPLPVKLLQTRLIDTTTAAEIFDLWKSNSSVFDAIHLTTAFEKLAQPKVYKVNTHNNALKGMCARFVTCMKGDKFPAVKALYAPLALGRLEHPSAKSSWFVVFQGLVTALPTAERAKLSRKTIVNLASVCNQHKLGSHHFMAFLATEFLKRTSEPCKAGRSFATSILEHEKFKRENKDKNLHGRLRALQK